MPNSETKSKPQLKVLPFPTREPEDKITPKELLEDIATDIEHIEDLVCIIRSKEKGEYMILNTDDLDDLAILGMLEYGKAIILET